MKTPFDAAGGYRPAGTLEFGGAMLPVTFGTAASEYAAAREGAALVDRSDRGLLCVRGGDRKSWLHNLVTNAVKTLDERSGNYAFACDLRGKIQFDLNILALPERLLLDMDGSRCATAAAHFERFLITEDARIEDISTQVARLGCCGARAAGPAAALGVTNFQAMAALSSLELEGGATFFRHDFAGTPGFELIVPRGDAVTWWERLAASGAAPAGFEAIDALRIEAGIPWMGRDIDDKTLPAETQQIERAISFKKGCYLGQEVVERMRSHASLARRLVRLRIAGSEGVSVPAPLTKAGVEVGKVTSAAVHPRDGDVVALGYLKSLVREADGLCVGDPPRGVSLVG